MFIPAAVIMVVMANRHWKHTDTACRGACIERVRVAAGSGAMATRTTVSVLRPAAPDPHVSSDSEGDGRQGIEQDLGQDIEECLDDERSTRKLRTADQTAHVFAGGAAAQGPARLGDAVSPAEDAELRTLPKPTSALSVTETAYLVIPYLSSR